MKVDRVRMVQKRAVLGLGRVGSSGVTVTVVELSVKTFSVKYFIVAPLKAISSSLVFKYITVLKNVDSCTLKF